MMNVEQLIEHLRQFDPQMPVAYPGTSADAESVEQLKPIVMEEKKRKYSVYYDWPSVPSAGSKVLLLS